MTSLGSKDFSIPNAIKEPAELDPTECMPQAQQVAPHGKPPLLADNTVAPAEEKEHGHDQKAPAKKAKRKTALFEFSNTEAIKQKVRAAKLAKIKKPYNVHDKYHETGFFQWLAKNERFDNCTLSIIVINALWMAFDTDGNTAETILDAETVYVIADCFFFIYFTVEVCVRFCAFEKKQDCLKDGWFKFDATLVTLYAFDPFTIGFLAYVQGGGGLNLPTALLRLFRLARLSRLVRMLRSLPELMVMIKGMVTASASVSYTLALLMIITYVFAIALRNVVLPDSDIETTYFSSVPEAMHNLILFGTFLDSLSTFLYDLKADSPLCFIFSWIYIGLAALTVMNMLIGVLCEVISSVAAEEAESLMVEKVADKFKSIVAELDEDNDGSLNWEEFQKILDHPDALAALESVNVDPEGMIDMAEDYFFDDGEALDLEFDEFVSMLLDLRGGQQATIKDIVGLGKRLNGKFQGVTTRMDGLEKKMDNYQADVLSTLSKIASSIKVLDAKLAGASPDH